MPMNSHNYESLGDEFFQMLCQSLLVREFPNVQCFPVGMPDGGRDALSLDSIKGATVFQVKFSRNPSKLNDPVQWICKAIDGEQEKVERLTARGVTRFVLMTNAQGSSHLDAGQRDQVQKYMDNVLPIPGVCWWRDELDRRLENAFDLKLRYPAVLSGPDLLRIAWELATRGEDAERRRDALNAYFSYHYREDSTVRFKQVELASKSITELYIDVPAATSRIAKRDTARRKLVMRKATRRSFEEETENSDPGDRPAPREDIYIASDGTYARRTSTGTYQPVLIGCARLLTDPELVENFPFVVIEGAPGQGKSTLTQYLAQLQRARLLNRNYDVARYPKHHRECPMAIPFRLELRDLATWLKGIDPWSQDLTESERHGKPRSLEGAIAAHIEKFSGGIRFDVGDLNNVFKNSPTLLLLDALDEVADIDDRSAVVEAVCDTLARFEGNSIRPQVVITSRPTAIAGSPTFPVELFMHLSLAPLDEDLAVLYAAKWARARRLDDAETHQLPRTLKVKMRAGHIAQLAKNTMQLSILLSLVQRRGASLPDKRTELYNAYFDIFLDRESEKSAVVRDNRDLLFDIHRFLGFFLHSRAEEEKTSGRIRHERLKWLLRDYLTRERQPYDLIDALLKGMVERFGALVSRVQGQYEFEVQPLQEYFAARYLNDTAPPSPTGRERSGTKADRFDGISANPYWFNVTRFLAGCFNKGELADLAERVCDLVLSPPERGRPFARSLCVALLQDWVFSQSPRATRKVVRAVFDDTGLAWATTGYLDPNQSTRSDVLTLPAGGGAEFLVEVIWERLLIASPTERTQRLCHLLLRNADSEEIAQKWYEEYLNPDRGDKEAWLTIGRSLLIPRLLSDGQVSLVASNDAPGHQPALAQFIVQGMARVGGLPDSRTMELFEQWLNFPGDGGIYPNSWVSAPNLAACFVHPMTWLDELREFGEFTPDHVDHFATLVFDVGYEGPPIFEQIVRSAKRWMGIDLSGNLGPWVEVVQTLEETFGRTWTSIELGLMSGGIRNSRERGRGGESLLNSNVPLPVRSRYCKRMSGDVAWWKAQRELAVDRFDHGTWCIAAAIWTSSRTFVQLAPELDRSLRLVTALDRAAILIAAMRARNYASPVVRTKVDLVPTDPFISDTLALLSIRLPAGNSLAPSLLKTIDSPVAGDLCLEWLASSHAQHWSAQQWMKSVRKAHVSGGRMRTHAADVRGSADRRRQIVQDALGDPWEVPGALINSVTRLALKKKMSYKPVLQVATDESWFEDSDQDWEL